MRFFPSRYNYLFQLKYDDPLFIFNYRLCSLISIPMTIKKVVKELLNSPFQSDDLPHEVQSLVTFLKEGGFIVNEGFNEFRAIQDRFHNYPEPQSFSLTIIPTLKCNLRCIYCYQNHSNESLGRKAQEGILNEISRRIENDDVKIINVDWYGGEPLLKLELIKCLSKDLLRNTKKYTVDYKASLVTNGTLLDEKAAKILHNAKITNVQITIDGPPVIHNHNRPYLSGAPSFNDVMQGILSTKNMFQVSLRINVDNESVKNISNFLKVLDDYGCFDKGFDVRPYIAMIGPLTASCSHTCRSMVPFNIWFKYVLKFQREVINFRYDLDHKEILEFPRVLNQPCGALSKFSICVHPTGTVYKCGLQVDNPDYGGGFIWEPYWKHPNYTYWIKSNPLMRVKCRKCNFLPICMGGCPIHNFSKNSFYKHEACNFWSTNIKSILEQFISINNIKLFYKSSKNNK